MANRLAKALAAMSVLLPLLSVATPRLISLSPANTELAFAAGITPVGVSSHSDYPAQARKVEQVANWQGINLERIIALKPDLVLAWRGGSPVRQVQQLSAMGIRVLWVDAVTIEQVAGVLRQLAPWSPAPEKARQAAQSLLSEYAHTQNALRRTGEKACFSAAQFLTFVYQRKRFHSESGYRTVRRGKHLCPGSLASGEPRTGSDATAAGNYRNRWRG